VGQRIEESTQEKGHRQLIELLQELRVALPGVQVLFAFLLTVPFTQAFPTLSEFERKGYFFVLCATAVATAFLIAPTAIHRLLFRQGMKREIVMRSNTLSLIGLAVLAVAMTGAVTLIAHIIFGQGTAIVAAVGTGVVITSLWYVLPIATKAYGDWDDDEDSN
jgi:hypothetical protein